MKFRLLSDRSRLRLFLSVLEGSVFGQRVHRAKVVLLCKQLGLGIALILVEEGHLREGVEVNEFSHKFCSKIYFYRPNVLNQLQTDI